MNKICIVGPSLKMGGMERASVNLANALSERGIEVVFISFFKQDHFFVLNPNIFLVEPIGFNFKRLDFFKTVLWIRRIVRQQNPDRVIVFNKLYSAITCLSLISSNYKIYISERSSPLYRWPKFQNIIINIIFKFVKPYGVIAQTSVAKEFQQKYFGKGVKIEVIPNALRMVKTYPLIAREKIILCAGRLNDPLKGFDRLLLAFAKIEKNGWVLQIAGGNANEDSILDKLILDNSLTDHVQFLGKIKDVDPILAQASIFVIPSRSEGFPNALCEAMAAGLACISYDFVAGPRDIIENKVNGVIIEEGNVDALAVEIQKLMVHGEERKRLGASAKAAVDKYSSLVIADRTYNFLIDA